MPASTVLSPVSRAARLCLALAMTAALVFTATGLGGCATNKTTGESQLLFLSWDEEIALGEEAKSELTRGYGGSVENRIVSSYIDEVGASLVQAAVEIDPKLGNLPWEFTLLDSEVINAFALPGGKIFASRGLLENFENEAQMAYVLGHEIGHVAGRHGNERVSQATSLAVVGQVAGAVVGDSGGVTQYIPAIIDQGSGLYLMSYGRSQELESDRLGIRYMVMAGYDPEGAVQALAVLAAAAQGPGQPEILSTHPNPERRIRDARKLIADTYPDTMGTLNEREYRSRYLNEMALLHPPAHAPLSAPTDEQARLALAMPAAYTWCAHCAEAESGSDVANP